METKGREHKICVSADGVASGVSLCSGLYCWIVGSLASLFPHPGWVVASLLIAPSLSTAINALVLRFSSDK